ncbi:ATP-binding cassette domain-containing protein [Streptomyces sp. NPDC090442]|uniref:ATP-binding cassette domain-containing protein n=1 Tax=Streptomyces sp. NPDC090442 TaxID=3365962 RepID=UPI0037F4359B
MPVLDRLDLVIDHRATVLLGPNGAGKSTLMGIAASWISPTRGSVAWRGVEPSRAKARAAYRRAVGWLPQHVRPMPGLTVRENVAYLGRF